MGLRNVRTGVLLLLMKQEAADRVAHLVLLRFITNTFY